MPGLLGEFGSGVAGDTGDGDRDSGDVHIQTPEYGTAVNYYTTDSQPVSRGRADASIRGTQAEVGTGRAGIHRP